MNSFGGLRQKRKYAVVTIATEQRLKVDHSVAKFYSQSIININSSRNPTLHKDLEHTRFFIPSLWSSNNSFKYSAEPHKIKINRNVSSWNLTYLRGGAT